MSLSCPTNLILHPSPFLTAVPSPPHTYALTLLIQKNVNLDYLNSSLLFRFFFLQTKGTLMFIRKHNQTFTLFTNTTQNRNLLKIFIFFTYIYIILSRNFLSQFQPKIKYSFSPLCSSYLKSEMIISNLSKRAIDLTIGILRTTYP